ncbi:hypothetical protein LR48_Vigan588s003200 [Vigna angularis]|uniref:Uncharacterized protein n=1 Tax=Phaseolus angularis TaxID=3914 RepID=A0A0L9TFC4_PHAAN|nr:hypothetical protein LR48_Vigan588s003200 [Vigna angularis]
MNLALHCHGELELTMEENGRDGDPRKKNGDFPLPKTRSKMVFSCFSHQEDRTLVAW